MRTILRAIPEGQLFTWGLFDREPLAPWSLGHVRLRGDAAHPVLPFLGHGAVLAIEDAVVFAESRRAVRIFHATDPTNYADAVGNVSVDEGLGLFAYNPVQCPV